MFANLWSNVISVLCSKTFEWGVGETALGGEEVIENGG